MKKALILFFISFGFILAQPQPYVVLISFDGFRWDYSERGITPNIELMKESGVTAKSLQPCFPSKTFPNHISIITGMYPEHHGIISNEMYDLKTGKSYGLDDRKSVKDPSWYKGTAFWEVAGANNIKTASFYWPQSSINDPKRVPTYTRDYDQSVPFTNRIDTVLYWLKMPYKERPHFITVYFHETDSYGHEYGPDSPEINISIARHDSLIGRLYNGLAKINMSDSVNVILVSDHGMTNIYPDKTIEIDKILPEDNYRHINDGPFFMIEPEKSQFNKVLSELKSAENHYNTYTKETIPGYFHYSDNDLIYSIILIADPGWSIYNSPDDGTWYAEGKGNHGYDNYFLDMHGTFVAAGPAFKKNYKTGTIQNIDIFPLLANIFNLKIKHKIDGRLDRIKYILSKEEN